MVFFCILSPFFSFLPMNDPKAGKAGVFSWISGVYGWKAGVFCLKSNEYQKRTWWRSFLILVGIDYTYIWFSFIPFTHLFICLIFCLFLWRAWRRRFFGLIQVIVRSFLLKEKNQKFKAHTAEATVSVAALKSRKTRLRLRQPRFFDAPLGRPLNASSVRPKQLKMENGELRIESSFGTGFYGIYLLNKSNASRGAACCTPGSTINMFVILLIVIGLCKTSLWGAARCASTVARQVSWINAREKKLSIVNSQLSIEGPASFWWALSVGTEWSGRSVAVWAEGEFAARTA